MITALVVAAFGVLVADYLATFVSEFSYIWKCVAPPRKANPREILIGSTPRRPITFTKVAFWLSRYIGLLGQGLVFNCLRLRAL